MTEQDELERMKQELVTLIYESKGLGATLNILNKIGEMDVDSRILVDEEEMSELDDMADE